MRKLNIVLVFVILFASLVVIVQKTQAKGSYNVYCASSKLEVDSRSLEQMKTARGSDVCLLAEFSSLSDAEKYADEHGGKGSPCNCK